VKELFENEATIYLGWIHFLALDLLAARWLWNQFRTSDLQVYVTFPILFLCMMVAPFGVLLGMATLKTKGELEMMVNEPSLD